MLRRNVLSELATHEVKVSEPDEDNVDQNGWDYGNVYAIKFERPVGHPDLIVVTTTLGITCGEDTSLYIFRRTEQHWNLILAEEANDYAQVDGAHGMFHYDIAGDSKDFYVVTLNVNPWCTSNWQSIRYAAVRVGQDAYQPVVLAKGKQTIYIGVEPPVYQLVVRPKSFSISFEGESNHADIMNGINSRTHVIRYKIYDSHAIRVSH